jgi:hypothetical protein
MRTFDTQTATAADSVARAVPVFAPDQPVASLACVKIQAHHRERLAIPYVRQSSPQQVRNNRESTGRQYALRDYALSLGWSSERILVIDDDQAHTAQTRTEDRSGFQRLLAEVTMDHDGIIVGLDMSRLARCDMDWHGRATSSVNIRSAVRSPPIDNCAIMIGSWCGCVSFMTRG